MFLSVENISTLQSNKYISEEAFERDYKVYPEKGDILMTRIGDIGTTNVVESTEKVAFYVSLALLKTKITNPYFLSNAMKNEAFQKGLRQRSLLTAIPQKINKDENCRKLRNLCCKICLFKKLVPISSRNKKMDLINTQRKMLCEK